MIDKNTAGQCYRKWHYLKDTAFISTYDFGVFTGDCLWGCISFGSPNATELDGYFDRHNQKGWFEIKRLALSDYCPRNSESRIIAVAIRLLKKIERIGGIITYADSGVGHTGIIYKASGFKYLGKTALRKDFYINGKIQQRGKTKGKIGEWKDRSQKHLYCMKLY